MRFLISGSNGASHYLHPVREIAWNCTTHVGLFSDRHRKFSQCRVGNYQCMTLDLMRDPGRIPTGRLLLGQTKSLEYFGLYE